MLDLRYVLDAQPGGGGHLLVRGIATELGRELAMDARDLALPLLHAGWEADDPSLADKAVLDRLTDPQRRVGGEPEASAPIELLHGAFKAERPFLDEVQQGHLRRDLVAPGDRDDEAQIVVDELLLGGEVAAFDEFGRSSSSAPVSSGKRPASLRN